MVHFRRIFGIPGTERAGSALTGLLLIQALFGSQLLLLAPCTCAAADERISPAVLAPVSADICRSGRCGGAAPPSSATPSGAFFAWKAGGDSCPVSGILAGAGPGVFRERCGCLSSILSFSFPGAVSPTPFP
jgi:hypothetical protein